LGKAKKKKGKRKKSEKAPHLQVSKREGDDEPELRVRGRERRVSLEQIVEQL
jgi:hypothetical protein